MRLLMLLPLLAACGGKIAPDPNAHPNPGGSGTSDTSPTSADAPPSDPSPLSIEDACAIVCERNGRCGAGYEPDCIAKCHADAISSCSNESIAFTTCWARTLHGCGMLAPECEPSYCAYTACTGIVQPSYCH